MTSNISDSREPITQFQVLVTAAITAGKTLKRQGGLKQPYRGVLENYLLQAEILELVFGQSEGAPWTMIHFGLPAGAQLGVPEIAEYTPEGDIYDV